MAFTFPPAAYEIGTPRLVIRTPVPADAEVFVDIFGNEKNLPAGETGAPSMTVEKGLSLIDSWRDSSSKGKNAFLAVSLRDTGEVVGHMGFNCFRTEAEAEGTEPERETPLPGPAGRYLTDVGVAIDHRHRRKGYSSETICAAIEFAFDVLGCQVVRMETGLENEPWRALMRSLGCHGLEEKGLVSFRGDTEGWLYKVDETQWSNIKRSLEEKGKWPL